MIHPKRCPHCGAVLSDPVREERRFRAFERWFAVAFVCVMGWLSCISEPAHAHDVREAAGSRGTWQVSREFRTGAYWSIDVRDVPDLVMRTNTWLAYRTNLADGHTVEHRLQYCSRLASQRFGDCTWFEVPMHVWMDGPTGGSTRSTMQKPGYLVVRQQLAHQVFDFRWQVRQVTGSRAAHVFEPSYLVQLTVPQ